MRGIRRDELEDFVTILDTKVQEGALKWKTATNVWGSVAKFFNDATNAKDRSLRILSVNPAHRNQTS